MKKTKDYTLLALAIPFFIAVSFNLGLQQEVKVLRSATDERGLTSVEYTKGGDTLALDYLTKTQLDSLTGHACRWINCPYKGVTAANAREAIIQETGSDSTDSYGIDSMHLVYPALDYDQLDALIK